MPCNHPDCKTRPIYNYEGETKAIYCATHKLDGMINVKNKSCNHPNCKIIPVYNYEGKTKAIYCATHKLDGMIDVKSKSCNYPNCKTRPIYNYEGKTKAIYCATHKLDGMIDVKNKSCNHLNCKTQPNYNYEGETKAIYCATHKLDGMIDVKHKSCKNEWCTTLITTKYDGYCMYCYMNMFPDKPVSRNYKTKEKEVVDKIKKKYPDFTWVSDKKVEDGCSKRRPDLLLDMGDYIIIIEVDENKHTDYDCSCENKRLMELSQDLQHRPIVFIRFNPDSYINQDGNKITSCWKTNKMGVIQIMKTKMSEWEERINILNQQIQYWIDNKTNKTIEIIQLFYDN